MMRFTNGESNRSGELKSLKQLLYGWLNLLTIVFSTYLNKKMIFLIRLKGWYKYKMRQSQNLVIHKIIEIPSNRVMCTLYINAHYFQNNVSFDLYLNFF